MTTATEKVLTDRDAAADLAGVERPDNPTFGSNPERWVPKGGRVTVERMLSVYTCRDMGSKVRSAGGCYDRPVTFTSEIEGDKHCVRVEVTKDTALTLSLDTFLDVALALCPPWLLRKKLGL